MRRSSLCLIALLSVVFLFCCAQAQELANVQILKEGSVDDDIKGLDPYYFLGATEEPMARAIYEGLVRWNFGNVAIDKMEPALAESWEVSDDGLVWTFYLRQGVMFHHGYGEFTAEDAKFTLERQMGTGAVHAGDYADVQSVGAPDPYTLVVKLAAPDPFWLFKVGNHHGGQIVCKRAVDELADGYAAFPVGTGPFRFEEWLPKEKVVLSRHDSYWRGRPILERIEFIFMPDHNTRSLAVESGEVDTITIGLKEESWVESMRSKGVIIDVLGYDQPLTLHFNMTMPPLDELNVRMALAHATDRMDFVEYAGGSLSRPQRSPLPATMYGAIEEGVPDYPFDLDRAKQLLAEAGYPNGFDLGTVYASPREVYLVPLEILQAQWEKVAVTFEIAPVAHAEYHSLIRQDLCAIVIYPGPRPTADMIFTQYLHSDSIVGKETAVTNFSHYGDVDCDGDGDIDGIDEYIELARSETIPQRQKGYYALAQIQTLLDLPVFPLRVSSTVQARQPWVDLGHEPYQPTYMVGYVYTEKTRILKH